MLYWTFKESFPRSQSCPTNDAIQSQDQGIDYAQLPLASVLFLGLDDDSITWLRMIRLSLLLQPVLLTQSP